MKFTRLQSRTLRQIKYVIYITIAITTVALMLYLNFKRERKLQTIQEQRLLVQEQFDKDPRFTDISTGIDKRMLASTITGSVVNQEDYKELTKKLSKIPPFPGTLNWKVEVEIRDRRNQ